MATSSTSSLTTTSSNSAGSILFSGLSSGIDTDSIISQLMAAEQKPIQIVQNQVTNLQGKQTALKTISAALTSYQAAASALTGYSSFGIVTAASSNEAVATISADSGTQAGTHSLKVTQLAQTHRIAATAVTDKTDPLNYSGQIVINGVAVSVSNSDSLESLVSNINSANTGVTASIVSPTSNTYTLTLTANNQGVDNKIQLSDVGSGNILQQLGLVGSTSTTRDGSATKANSALFSDSSTSVGTLLGLTSPTSGSFQINGTSISVDMGVDSLAGIAVKINSAGIDGVSADVVSTTDSNGDTHQQLQISGSNLNFTDGSNILANLGVVQNNYTNQLTEARDAKFTIDDMDASRSSNTITDLIAGATITLKDDTSSPSTTLSVSSDTDTLSKNIQSFVSAYNTIVTTYNNYASYDTETTTAGILFGDATVQSTINNITNTITGSVKGLSGTYNLLSDIGITLNNTGTLDVDSGKLSTALTNNLSDVKKIFSAVGTATDSGVAYVSSTSATQPSSSYGYGVYISHLATQAQVTGSVDHTSDDNPSTESLTFGGALFGSANYTVLVGSNSTLDGIASQINSDANISKVLSASVVNNKLQITSKSYGTSAGFTVVSDQAAAFNNSGIGNTTLTSYGTDVAGTINGEDATGNGQILTGNSGNSTTDGLALRITAYTTGTHGTITFTRGVADQIVTLMKNDTDSVNGSLTLYSSTIDSQISDLNDQISTMNDRVSADKQHYRDVFSAMEAALSKLNTAASALSSLTANKSS